MQRNTVPLFPFLVLMALLLGGCAAVEEAERHARESNGRAKPVAAMKDGAR